MKECETTKEWFKKIGENEEERMKKIWNDDLDKKKAYVLKKLWFEKEKEKKKKGEERYRGRKKWRKRVGNIRINNS